MPSPKHLAVIAAAGSHKTEFIVNEALAATGKRVLITTYTNENLSCIHERIRSKVGRVPDHITIMSWYQFLASQWCRPYQRAVLGEPGLIRGVDFQSNRVRFIPQSKPRPYYTNKAGDLYKDWVADFAVKANEKTSGAAIARLEQIYDEIYVDEVQDLVGYDLDVLDFMLGSQMRVVMVGDPRQHTYATNANMKNKKYRGAGIIDWLNERAAQCNLQTREVSYRCNQAVCDFADALFPGLLGTSSMNLEAATPTGILMLQPSDVTAHVKACNPLVLRWDVRTDTLGLAAINFGVSKGSTHDHVLIFPTGTMKTYLMKRDPSALADGARSKLYVGVTRARHSVAFVI